MREISVTSLVEFLSAPMWDTKRLIYRGVPDSSFDLLPSVGRLASETPEGLRRFEKEVLEDFSRRALPFLNRVPSSELDWMFLAQHYGVPTRLLDWTTNPLVAMYFAANATDDADFAVYQTLMPKWLHNLNGTSPFELQEVLGVAPPHADARYINQEGVFTIHPIPDEPYAPRHMTRFVVPKERRDELRWQLRKLGYGTARVFPGLEGLARDIVQDNDLHLRRGTIRGSSRGDA